MTKEVEKGSDETTEDVVDLSTWKRGRGRVAGARGDGNE